jgi:hypothetical protein
VRNFRVFLLVLALFGLFLTVSLPLLPTRLPVPVCSPSKTKIDEASGYPEIQVTASSGRLWALLHAPDGKFNAGTKARILWKMTDGRGDIKLSAIHEDGTQAQLIWGPVSRRGNTDWTGLFFIVLRQAKKDWKDLPSMRIYREGSDWKHPGQEWGSEFIFPKAGCWRILVARWLIASDKAITGEIAVEVKP